MIRIIRGNVTDSKLAAVPDRTNGSLSLSLNRGPSFFSLHFFSFFFFTSCVNYFRLFFFTWPERERERSLNLGMAVFPGRWQWENWSIERVPTQYSMQLSSRVVFFSFLFFLLFFVCAHIAVQKEEKEEKSLGLVVSFLRQKVHSGCQKFLFLRWLDLSCRISVRVIG